MTPNGSAQESGSVELTIFFQLGYRMTIEDFKSHFYLSPEKVPYNINNLFFFTYTTVVDGYF